MDATAGLRQNCNLPVTPRSHGRASISLTAARAGGHSQPLSEGETPMHDTDDIGSNQSGNPHLQDMIDARIERRTFLGGSLAVAATGFFGSAAGAQPVEPVTGGRGGRSRLAFEAIAPSTDDAVRLPAGYEWQLLAPWGTPLLPGAAAFAEDASNTAAEQALQVGLQPRRHALLPAAAVRQFARPAGRQPRVHRRQPDLHRRAGHGDHRRCRRSREGRQGARRARRQRDLDPEESADGCGPSSAATSATAASPARRPMAFSGPVAASHPMLQFGDHARAARHAQQLRPRLHALGHLPGLRGELERLLRHRRHDVGAQRRSRRAMA